MELNRSHMTTKPPYAPSTAAYPSNIHEECTALERTVSQLSYLASCFYATGNVAMADKLDEAANLIKTATQAIRDHTGVRINADFKTAQEMSGAVLKAVLVGTKMAKISNHD